MEKAFAEYVAVAKTAPKEADAWKVVDIGRHRLGVGSYRSNKYLVRIRGESDSDDDDRIWEAKEVSENPAASCIPDLLAPDPLRVLVGATRLAYPPTPRTASIQIDGRAYWMHEWADDYTELDVADRALDEAQLLEVVYDIGVQLGRGHPKRLRDPLEAELRAQLDFFVRAQGSTLWAESARASEEVWSAWASLVPCK